MAEQSFFSSVITLLVGGVLGGSLATAVFQNASKDLDKRNDRLLRVESSVNDLKEAQVSEFSANAEAYDNSGRRKWRNGVDLALRDERNAKSKSVRNALSAAPDDDVLTDCVRRFQDSVDQVVYAHSLPEARAANTKAQGYVFLVGQQVRRMINADSVWRELTNNHPSSTGSCPALR